MPYKHIAAHLKKTELACRLHYHQLSHGSHRRKRPVSEAPASHPASANASPNLPQYAMTVDDYDRSGDISRQSSPASYHSNSPSRHPMMGVSPSVRGQQHKILLPKPQTLTPQGSPEPYGGALRINTADNVIHPPSVDTDRLRAIYEARRATFWASVAAEYGPDVSPAQLERIWQQGNNVVRPPTPEEMSEDAVMGGTGQHHAGLKPSPMPYGGSVSAVDAPRGFSPINAHPSSAVESRLPAYMLPNPHAGSAPPSRGSSWGGSNAGSSGMAISAMLTDDKCPRGS